MIRLFTIAAKKAVIARREGRLPASPLKWARLLRQLSSELRQESAAPVVASVDAAPVESPRDASTVPAMDGDSLRMALAAFLAGSERLSFQAVAPRASLVIVTHNQAGLTLRCLKSLLAATIPIEVVIVDNASTDATPRLLDRLDGATVVRNTANDGFLRAANAGARRANADTLVFLNNDTIVEAGSLEAACDTLHSSDTIGAVVGRLVHLDGRLQEAGSIIWRDGTGQAYGRGDDPWAPPYMFRRNVDYGSGAFLATPRSLFLELGGFDERYAPAYYEDVDYCVRLWQQGARVVYEPRALIRHVEFGSSSPQDGLAGQAERRSRFISRHGQWLEEYTRPRGASLLRARSRWTGGQRILLIDDRVPHPRLGSGYPRAHALLHVALDLGHDLTLYPLLFPREPWDEAYADIPRDVEILIGAGAAGLAPHLNAHAADYDTIIVSRPHNMRVFRAAADAIVDRPALIYDAEAIFALRDVRRLAVEHPERPAGSSSQPIAQEVSLARAADVVTAVSPGECRYFTEAGMPHALVLSHAVRVITEAPPFAARSTVLFVGALVDARSPNADSMRWFLSDVWPALRQRLGPDARFVIAGRDPGSVLAAFADPSVVRLGIRDDLSGVYAQARIFVAPTRFAAGLPTKVIEAAAHAVPVVGTQLIADQLEWRDGVELLVASEAASFVERACALYTDEGQWSRVQAAARARVAADYSYEAFSRGVERALLTAQDVRFGSASTLSGVGPMSEPGSK